MNGIAGRASQCDPAMKASGVVLVGVGCLFVCLPLLVVFLFCCFLLLFFGRGVGVLSCSYFLSVFFFFFFFFEGWYLYVIIFHNIFYVHITINKICLVISYGFYCCMVIAFAHGAMGRRIKLIELYRVPISAPLLV